MARNDWILLAASFLLSFPVMWFIKVYAIFARGFVIWFAPWFLSPLGESVFGIPDTLGTNIVFMILAAIQNAIITWLYIRYRDKSKLVRFLYWFFVSFIVVVVVSIFLRHYMSFGQLFPVPPSW